MQKGRNGRGAGAKDILTHRREVVSMLFGAIYLFLTFSFISFNPADPSPFHFASDVKVITHHSGLVSGSLTFSQSRRCCL